VREPTWESREPRDREIAALNRQIDHLLDQRRIKRHAIPSDTTAGPTKPMGDRDAQVADHVAEAPR
jgi:hypothetical protein